MSEERNIQNICYHGCHRLGKPKCYECRIFHQSDEPVATHKNDNNNPDYEENER